MALEWLKTILGDKYTPEIDTAVSQEIGNYLMVEQVKHTFKESVHLMDLKMRGGTFVA